MAYIGNEPADRFTSIPTVQQFNGDASTTAFTLNRAVGSDQDLLVSVDGVIQDTAAYAVSNGTTLTFSAAPSQGTANIFVNHLGLTIGSVVHPASSALAATTGTFSGEVVAASLDISGNIDVDGTTNLDVVDIDGAVDMASTLQVDGAITNSSTIVSAGKITADAGIDIDNFNIDGTTIALSSGDLTVDVAGSIELNADSGNVVFADADVTFGQMQNGSGSQFIMQGMVADQDMIFKINNGGSTINAILVDSIGAVTMPSQPAFLARPASQQANFAINGSVSIVFGTEVYDQNADFASNAFTAPVTGKYVLNTSIRLSAVDSAADYYHIQIVTSNRSYQNIFDPDFGQDAAYWALTVSCVADMDAGDTAYVAIVQGGGTQQTDIETQSHFSGYLAC